MKEVEIKILEVNRKEVEAKLISLGAKITFDGEMNAIYYDDKQVSIRKDVLLRVRKENDKTILTVKKKNKEIKDVKSQDEYEVEVLDLETMRKILSVLNFDEYLTLRKTRTQYSLNGIHFVFDKYLDNWEFIPEFLEIEAESEEKVFESAKLIGFSKEDCKPWSGKDVAKHYGWKP